MDQQVSHEESRRHERHAHDDRREEILAAVRDACAEEGVSRFSVSSITKRVGCTRSLFYHYFPDKEAALNDIIESFIERLQAWNSDREQGDIEGALDDAVALMKHIVLDERDPSKSLATGGNAALYTAFVHRVADRTARYICDSTVVDFARYHEVRIDHVYVLITGLVMYIRTHPDAPDDLIKDIVASTLHIEGYTEKYKDRRPER